jgi:hypothetical protein
VRDAALGNNEVELKSSLADLIKIIPSPARALDSDDNAFEDAFDDSAFEEATAFVKRLGLTDRASTSAFAALLDLDLIHNSVIAAARSEAGKLVAAANKARHLQLPGVIQFAQRLLHSARVLVGLNYDRLETLHAHSKAAAAGAAAPAATAAAAVTTCAAISGVTETSDVTGAYGTNLTGNLLETGVTLAGTGAVIVDVTCNGLGASPITTATAASASAAAATSAAAAAGAARAVAVLDDNALRACGNISGTLDQLVKLYGHSQRNELGNVAAVSYVLDVAQNLAFLVQDIHALNILW